MNNADHTSCRRLCNSCDNSVHLFYVCVYMISFDMLGELSRLTQTRVLAIDYRPIPEAAYDIPLKDVIHAWDYATNGQWGMAVKPQDIIVAGESAGGTLTSLLVTSLQRRTQYKSAEALPRAVILCSTFDFSMNESASRQTNGIRYPTSHQSSDPLVTTHILKWNTQLLSTCGSADTTGRFYSPLYQATVDVDTYQLSHAYQHFPKTMIQCGKYEALIDDSEAILKAMTSAGVDVTHTFPEWYIHSKWDVRHVHVCHVIMWMCTCIVLSRACLMLDA